MRTSHWNKEGPNRFQSFPTESVKVNLMPQTDNKKKKKKKKKEKKTAAEKAWFILLVDKTVI